MENKERRGPQAIDGLIRSFLRENNLTGNAGHIAVFQAWNEVSEPAMRNQTEPVMFRGGRLTVEVSSASLLQELRNFTGEGLRKQVNLRLGREAIRRVVFKIRG